MLSIGHIGPRPVDYSMPPCYYIFCQGNVNLFLGFVELDGRFSGY